MRKSLYLSERMDTDILQELDIGNIPPGDFSLVAKNLMRDGIKWRRVGKADETREYHSPSHKNVADNSNPKKQLFRNMKLQKKTLSPEELEEKFSNL